MKNYSQQIRWSCAWLINLWARLGDGTKANYYYEELLRESVYDNLFDLHPPLGETDGEREVFRLMEISEVQVLLRKCCWKVKKEKLRFAGSPESWKTGSIKGLLAVGNIRVDLSWKDGKPKRVPN